MEGTGTWGHAAETLAVYGLSILTASCVSYCAPRLINCSLLCFTAGIFFITPLVANVIMKWRSRERLSPAGKAVFISGCDTGFGHLTALRLDKRGFQVFAGCLFPNGEGAELLRLSGSSRMHVIGLDVTSDASVQKAAAYVNEKLNGNDLWAVVNNAGIYDIADVHWANTLTAQKLFEVNCIGPIRVTQAFLSKLMLSKGRVVTVASLIGRCALAHNVVYSMTKYAAVGFSEGLRMELDKWGVQVVSIEPWMYRTALAAEINVLQLLTQNWTAAPEHVKGPYRPDYIENLKKDLIHLMKYFYGRSPSTVADDVEKAVMSRNPRTVYYSGDFIHKCLALSLEYLPRPLTESFMTFVMP